MNTRRIIDTGKIGDLPKEIIIRIWRRVFRDAATSIQRSFRGWLRRRPRRVVKFEIPTAFRRQEAYRMAIRNANLNSTNEIERASMIMEAMDRYGMY